MFNLFRRPPRVLTDDAETAQKPITLKQLEAQIASKGLQRPPSLNRLSSITSSTSLNSLNSLFISPNGSGISGFNSIFTSPNGSGNRSRRGSFAMFSRDSHEHLLLRIFPYEEIDPGIDGVEHNGDFEFSYISEAGEQIVDLIKIPISFLRTMRPLWRRHNIFATWRLGSDPFTKLNRRRSFSIDGEIIYDPKQTNTSTQTEGPYKACEGRIPESDKFRTKPYKLKDNNFAGSFHESIKDQPCDEELLAQFKNKVSEDIVEVKHFHNMICYSKMVEVNPSEKN